MKTTNKFLDEDYPKVKEELRYASEQLESGRDYLMRVPSNEITVEDALEAFGFGRNGLH